MTAGGQGLLFLILLPALLSLACLLLVRTLRGAKLLVGLGGGVLTVTSLLLMRQFGPSFPAPLVDASWIPSWGARLQLAADPLGLALAALSALIIAFAAFEGRGLLEASPRGAGSALFLLLTALNGVFLSRDLLLFFFFWELSLVPMLILIGRWGGENRLYAARLFVLFTMAGSALMLAGLAGLGLESSAQGGPGYSLQALAQLHLDPAKQNLYFWCFLAAFAVKVPIFPLHGWLPVAHVEAPTLGSMLLAGVLLKMGGFGLVRILLPLFPDAAHQAAPVVAALGCAGLLYGSLAALGQGDLKRLVALSSVGHLGVATAALFTGSPLGLEGAVFILVSHGVTSAGLFYVVGLIYGRTHTRDMSRLGGLAKALPSLSWPAFVLVLASIGVPLTGGFVGEFLAILGSYSFSKAVTVSLCAGVVLGAVYMLGAYQKVFLGSAHGDAHALDPLSWAERTPLLLLALLSVALGLWPEMLLAPLRASLAGLGVAP